jgi:hypothetical protein
MCSTCGNKVVVHFFELQTVRRARMSTDGNNWGHLNWQLNIPAGRDTFHHTFEYHWYNYV